MSKISKKAKIIAAAAFIIGTSAIGTGVTYANTKQKQKNPHIADIIEALAEKFDLDSSEVEVVIQDVLELQRKENEANYEYEFTNKLNEAIKESRLKQVQADLILAKKEELKDFMVDFKSLDEDERKELMKSHMKEMKDWANKNDIPEEFMKFEHKGYDRLWKSHTKPKLSIVSES